MRTLALVDGEHYPPVTRAALEVAGERGHEIVAALLVGGTEKLATGDDPPDLGVPVIVVAEEPMARLAGRDRRALAGGRPRPLRRAGAGLSRADGDRRGRAGGGVPYVGPDFRLDPPERGPAARRCRRSRSSAPASGPARPRSPARWRRLAARRGLEPVIVAMGRGGPPEPTLAMAGTVDLDHLVRAGRRGRARRLRLPGGRHHHRGHDRRARGAPAAGSPARPTPPTSGRPPSWRPPSAPGS